VELSCRCKTDQNFDKTGFGVYDISIKNKEAPNMMEYISDLHQKYKPRTIRRKIASVKAFCSYLEYEELIAENPFAKLQLKLNAPRNSAH